MFKNALAKFGYSRIILYNSTYHLLDITCLRKIRLLSTQSYTAIQKKSYRVIVRNEDGGDSKVLSDHPIRVES